MIDNENEVHETEAGDAGKARRIADQAPRQDRDRWDGFSIEETRKTRAAAPPPLTPPDERRDRSPASPVRRKD